MSSMLEGLGAALQALDGSAPLQRRRPALRPTKQPLLAPPTVLLRMLLKETAGVWRPAWVEVRPDGRILVFPETLTGGVGAPTDSRHVERLVDFMPVLDDFKAVCLRFLPPAPGVAPVSVVLASAGRRAGGVGTIPPRPPLLASSPFPSARAHASESSMQALLASLSGHELLYGHCRAEQCTQLKRLLALSRLPFDARRLDHAQLLEHYWRACARRPWQGSTGEQWLALGFQGRDPATDFRGMGLLGLIQLLYLATHHGATAVIEQLHSVSGGASFPLSVAGINLSQLLLRHLGADAETIACNPADSRWDSELFLFLCRAAVRQHERGDSQRDDALWHERSGVAQQPVAAPAAAAPAPAAAHAAPAPAAPAAAPAAAAPAAAPAPAPPRSSPHGSETASVGEHDSGGHAEDHAGGEAGDACAAFGPRGSVGDDAFGTEQPQLIGEVYCMLLLLLHQVYRTTNAHALDFPALLALVDAKLRHALSAQPGSLQQLHELLLPPEIRYTSPFR